MVEKDHKYGVTGGFFHKEIIPIKYDDIELNSNSYTFNVCLNKKWGNISAEKEMLVEIKYESLNSCMVDGLQYAQSDGKYGCIDYYGDILIPFIYDSFYPFGGLLYLVSQNGKYGVIDNRNHIAIPIIYDILVTYYYEYKGIYLLPVSQNEKWGVIDEQNNIIVPIIYDLAGCISSEMFTVKQNDKWGVVDRNNNIVVPIIYDEINESDDDRSILTVMQDGKENTINLSTL